MTTTPDPTPTLANVQAAILANATLAPADAGEVTLIHDRLARLQHLDEQILSDWYNAQLDALPDDTTWTYAAYVDGEIDCMLEDNRWYWLDPADYKAMYDLTTERYRLIEAGVRMADR